MNNKKILAYVLMLFNASCTQSKVGGVCTADMRSKSETDLMELSSMSGLVAYERLVSNFNKFEGCYSKVECKPIADKVGYVFVMNWKYFYYMAEKIQAKDRHAESIMSFLQCPSIDLKYQSELSFLSQKRCPGRFHKICSQLFRPTTSSSIADTDRGTVEIHVKSNQALPENEGE